MLASRNIVTTPVFTLSWPTLHKHVVNEHHAARKSHDATQKKWLHVVHFNVPRDWFETNSRHQKLYSKGGKKIVGVAVYMFKRGSWVQGVPSVERGDWGWEYDRLLYFANVCKKCCVLWRPFWKESRLIRSSQIQICWSFSERSIHELDYLKACISNKIDARFREISN